MRRGGRYYAGQGETSSKAPPKKKATRKKESTQSESASDAITTHEQPEVSDHEISR